MKRLALLTIILTLSSCYVWNPSDKVRKYDGEHIRVAIYDLGPNYTIRTDSIVGKVYSWRMAHYIEPEVDTTCHVTTSAAIKQRYVHIFTTNGDIITRTIYSVL